MFRTRDYALVLATIMFLLVAIVTTAATSSWNSFGGVTASVFESLQEEEEFGAVVVEDELNREERIDSLRKKIAKLDVPVIAESEPEPEPEPSTEGEDATVVTSEESEVVLVGEMRCTDYRTNTTAWSVENLAVDEVEGARIVYRETGSSTDPLTGVTTKDVLLQLPVRSVPLGGTHCLSSDVIGITKNGALIRNTDTSAYRFYGSDTLIGYALDGFPIYGSSAAITDGCGGAVIGGQYRYQLSNTRDVILNCFAGFPTAL